MKNKLRTIALIIWWCEGTKARKDKRWKNAYSKAIEVTNTNPQIISIFLDYLRNDLKLSNKKIHGQIQMHEDDNQKEIESFWSEKLNIPLIQFNKTIVRKKGNKPGKSKGTFKLRVYDKIIFEKLEVQLLSELRSVISGV
jgi:hypothetical protein